jgi:hypothetical protein
MNPSHGLFFEREPRKTGPNSYTGIGLCNCAFSVLAAQNLVRILLGGQRYMRNIVFSDLTI